MVRGLNAKSGCRSWWTMARTLESSGYKVVNSVLCNEICNDKWYNQVIFQQNNINTPKTVLVRHKEGAPFAADKLGVKYPIPPAYNFLLFFSNSFLLFISTDPAPS